MNWWGQGLTANAIQGRLSEGTDHTMNWVSDRGKVSGCPLPLAFLTVIADFKGSSIPGEN